MNYLRYLLILFFLFQTSLCFSQEMINDVFVCEEDVEAPPKSKFIDEIKVVDKGFKINCGHDLVLEQAIEKVKKKGGNILKITRWKKPSVFGSTCYQVWGEAYYIDDLSHAVASMPKAADTTTDRLIDASVPYAILYLYRPRAYAGSLLSYKVHVNDKELFKIANGDCDTFHVYETGTVKIWGTIETRSEVPLDIQPGHVYFIRCEIGMGIWAGRPHISIVEPNKGYNEYIWNCGTRR